MRLPTNGIRLENITLPKFYSVRFELLMDENENNDETKRIILTNKYPSFVIRIKGSKLFVTTKIRQNSNETEEHEMSITNEWLSFKKC